MILKEGLYTRYGNTFDIDNNRLFLQSNYGKIDLKLIEQDGNRTFKHISRLFPKGKTQGDNKEFYCDELLEITGRNKKKNSYLVEITSDYVRFTNKEH